MDKVDFRVERPDLYKPGARDFEIVEVPPLDFVMIDGQGDPNTSESYSNAVGALYAVSFAAKVASKQQLARDYVVPPLEGLWYAENRDAFTSRSKADWHWTMMIRQPWWLTDEIREAALAKASLKADATALAEARFDDLDEGLSAQILHIGSYDDEAPVIARLHDDFLPDNGYAENGVHHEIYLSDARRVAPSKLKTILRQPIRVG
jgi:hypothetical protein